MEVNRSVITVAQFINVINELELPSLDREWVSTMWRDKFLGEVEDIPYHYSEKFSPVTTINTMKRGQKIVKELLEISDSNWEVLKEFDYRGLLALTCYYIKSGSKESSTFDEIIYGIKALQFYLQLLLIPDCRTYNIYQTEIYENSMQIFLVYKYFKKNEFTSSEVDSIHEDLNELLIEFIDVIRVFPLNNNDTLKLTLTTMVEITRAERRTIIQTCKHNAKTAFILYMEEAFSAIRTLCDEVQGRQEETTRLVFSKLLANLSAYTGLEFPEMTGCPAAELTAIRTNTLWFIKTKMVTIGPAYHTNLKILIQHFIRSLPNRADLRLKYFDSILALIADLPEPLYYELLQWIFREAYSHAVCHRTTSLELISRLIYMKQCPTDRSNSAETIQQNVPETSNTLAVSTVQNNEEGSQLSASSSRVISFAKPTVFVPTEYSRAMLAIILDRIRDASHSVSSKALSHLSNLISNKSSPIVNALIESVFLDPYTGYDHTEAKAGFIELSVFFEAFDVGKTFTSAANLVPEGKVIVDRVCKKFLTSGNYLVRKSAIHLLLQLLRLNPYWMTNRLLSTLASHCRDPSKQLRKDTIRMMTELLLFYPDHSQVLKIWVQEVLPTVEDYESSVVDESLKALKEVILDKIEPYNGEESVDRLPWAILNLILSLQLRSLFKVACMKWNEKSDVWAQKKIQAIMTHIGSPHEQSVWALLASMTEFVSVKNPKTIFDFYYNSMATTENQDLSVLVALTVHNAWQELDEESRDALERRLYEGLINKSIPVRIVSISVDTVTTITYAKESKLTQADYAAATGGAHDSAKTKAAKLESKKKAADLAAKQKIHEWAKETALTCSSELEGCLDSPTVKHDPKCQKCIYNLILLGSLGEILGDVHSFPILNTLMNFLKTWSPENELKAVIVTTLARWSFGDSIFANRLVSVLKAFLSNYTEKKLLNNIIIALADIGERYPNMIEPLVPNLALCVKNECTSIRELALVVIIDLLRQDYLRPENLLVFHLLTLVNEPSERMASIVKDYFTRLLDRKHCSVGEILVKCMLHYNDYLDHRIYRLKKNSESEELVFSMQGPSRRKQRINVYRFLLRISKLSDRLHCASVLCQVIFRGVVNGSIREISNLVDELLLDTYNVLLSKELKFEEWSKKDDRERDRDDDDGEDGRTSTDKNQDTVIQGLYEEYLKTLVPICSEMKKKYSREPKQIAQLYGFLGELFRDTKWDIMDLFKDDKQFGEEIVHHIQNTPREINVLFPDENATESSAAREKAQQSSSREADRNEKNTKEGRISKKRSVEDLSQDIRKVRLTDSNVSARKSSEKSTLKRGHRSESACGKGKRPSKQLKRSASLSNISSEMPPPTGRPSRVSKRGPLTPSVPPKNQQLTSSTPLVANPSEFEAMDISPVGETNEKTT